MAPDIAIDASGTIYVTDAGSSRVLQYSPQGELTTWRDLRDTESGTSIVPAGIAVDASRTVYVTDQKNSTIQKFTLFKKEPWGGEGAGNSQFDHPAGIAVDSSGTVYIADTGNNRIQKIHSTGKYLLQWGSYGTAYGAFNAPVSIAIDADDHVYVADAGNSRIQKFSPEGAYLAQWGSKGTGAGQFQAPSGIAVDSWGNVYVADQTSRVQKFNPAGEYFTTCNTSGTTYDVAIDPSGTLYVLWQSGASWEIGEYRFPSSVSRETPVQRSTFAVLVPRTPDMPKTPSASDPLQENTSAQNPEPAETGTTIGPNVSTRNNASEDWISATLVIPATGATDTLSERGALATGRETGFFDRISGFLLSVFRMKSPLLP